MIPANNQSLRNLLRAIPVLIHATFKKSLTVPVLDQLIRALTASKLNQSQIAAKAGISQAQVSRIMDGKREPSLEVAERLAKAVGKRLVLK